MHSSNTNKTPKFKTLSDKKNDKKNNYQHDRNDKNKRSDRKFNEPSRPNFNKKPFANKFSHKKGNQEENVQTNYEFKQQKSLLDPKGSSISISKKVSTQVHVKKTGALSVRAPENIKKNRQEEYKACGEKACLRLFDKRPQDIIRAWISPSFSGDSSALTNYLSAHKKVFHLVQDDELVKISGASHHGGICLLSRKPKPLSLEIYLKVALKNDVVLVINQVNNPNNLGALLKTAACFNLKNIVIINANRIFAPNIMRIAEGALENLNLYSPTNIDSTVELLKKYDYNCVSFGDSNLTFKDYFSLNNAKIDQKSNKVALILDDNDEFINGVEKIKNSYNNDFALNINAACATFLNLKLML